MVHLRATRAGFALTLHWIRGHVSLDQCPGSVELLHARCNHAADLAAKRAARACLAFRLQQPPPEPPDPAVPFFEGCVALGSHGPTLLHMEELLIKPLDWPHGSLQWWAWCKALRSATWDHGRSAVGTCNQGLRLLCSFGGAALALCGTFVVPLQPVICWFKPVRRCITRRNPAAFPLTWGPRLGRYAGVAWPRGAWPGVYIQRTDEEQKWLERVLLRASRLDRAQRLGIFSRGCCLAPRALGWAPCWLLVLCGGLCGHGSCLLGLLRSVWDHCGGQREGFPHAASF